ncbi:MAG: hypothetical protein QG616_2199 [Pseudomonadota bacterium]|nr:hypothetical protein [Pseudomonadota bacterium]MDQ5914138.1 hypothetical protein [Pseudomonadota bacterium]
MHTNARADPGADSSLPVGAAGRFASDAEAGDV